MTRFMPRFLFLYMKFYLLPHNSILCVRKLHNDTVTCVLSTLLYFFEMLSAKSKFNMTLLY